MHCSDCGAEQSQGGKFCTECGESLDAVVADESDATRWEYKIESVSMNERWNPHRQQQELIDLEERLDQLGDEGWEMISYESIPMHGSFSAKLKGYAYLVFFKRQKS